MHQPVAKKFKCMLMVMRIRSSDGNFDLINIEMIPDGYKFGTMNALKLMIKDAAKDILPLSIRVEKIARAIKSATAGVH